MAKRKSDDDYVSIFDVDEELEDDFDDEDELDEEDFLEDLGSPDVRNYDDDDYEDLEDEEEGEDEEDIMNDGFYYDDEASSDSDF